MIEVYVPLRTISALNAREHWSRRVKRVRAERTAVSLLCGPKLAGVTVSFPATVKMTRVAPRTLDSDNLAGSLKGVRDSVADRLGVNDGDPKVTWTCAQRRGKPKEYGVEIEISFSTGVSDAMPVV